MPDSGFLISCASTAARPETERAAARCVSWRSIICAMERCCSISTMRPGSSGIAPANTSTSLWVPERGRPTSMPYSLTVAPLRRTWPTRAPSGLENAMMSASVWRLSTPWLSEKKDSAAALA